MTQFSVFSQLFDRAMERALPTNVVEKNDVFEISIKVPGVSRKDITVDIQGRVVKVAVRKNTIPVAVPVKTDPEDSSIENTHTATPTCVLHLAEFDIPVEAERAFQFREALDADSAALDLADGILTISVMPQQRSNKRTLTFSE